MPASTPRWQQIEAALDRILDQPEDRWHLLLDQVCGDDLPLRAEVEALLAADQTRGGLLDRDALTLGIRAWKALFASDPSETELLEEGYRVGPYRIVETLGRGGLGEVYLAHDERLERTVALKRLHGHHGADPSASLARFRREAKLAASLDHPSIVRVHDVLEQDDTDWLVMEHIEGETLAQRRRGGALAVPLALRVAVDIADALATAHDSGIVHRDLKAENVLITAGDRIKIVDFGLAKRSLSALSGPLGDLTITADQQILGTARSMSPEQVQGEPVDARTDLFSFGVLLYEILTGISPFAAENAAATLHRVCSHTPPPVAELSPEVPAGLSDLVASLLNKDKARRPASARAVHQALSQLLPDTGETLPASLQRPRGGPARLLKIGLFLLVTMVLGSAGHRWLSSEKSGSETGPPVYVAVPMTAVGSEATPDTEFLAAAVHTTLQHALSRLHGLAVVVPEATSDPATASAFSPDLVRRLAADEALSSHLACREGLCQLTLRRHHGADGRVLWASPVEIQEGDYRSLQTAITLYTRQAFEDHPPRSGTAEAVSHDAYEAFLQLRRAEKTRGGEVQGEDLLHAATALRRQEPAFLEVYLLELRISRELYYQSREPAFLEHALDVLTEAQRLAPEDPRIAATQFDVAAAAERWDLAAEALATLEQLEPSGYVTFQRRAELLAHEGRGLEALALMRQGTAGHPAAAALFNLALMEYGQGELDAARRTLEGLLARSPNFFKAHSFLAQLELLTGSPRRAVELYEALVAADPGGIEAVNLGTAYLLEERFEEAAMTFRRALEAQPRNAVIALNLADALALDGRPEEAQRFYLRTLEESARDDGLVRWQKLTVQAQAQAHLGRFRDAAALVQAALIQEPDNPQVALEAALVFTLIGDLNTAVVNAERALDEGISPRWFTIPWFEPLLTQPSLGVRLQDREAATP